MGTDAEIFVFDYEAYVMEVVPAFIDIFRRRQVVDWLHPFVKRRELDPSQWKKSDLALFPLRLKSDLSWVGPYDLRYTYDYRWQERWSHSVEGSEETRRIGLENFPACLNLKMHHYLLLLSD
jgi:hypothetical protein